MLSCNQRFFIKSLALTLLYFSLAINTVTGMESKENVVPTSPNKKQTIHFDEASVSIKTPPSSPTKKTVDSPNSLLSPIKSMHLRSPVGLKTPKKYIDTTPTTDILELFVTNFLLYEEKSPLKPLITFLFRCENEKLQRNKTVVDPKMDKLEFFPKFLWAEMSNDFFIKTFENIDEKLRACSSKKSEKEAINLIKSDFLQLINMAVEDHYRFQDCGSNCIQEPSQQRCKQCAKFKLSAYQKSWLKSLLDHLIYLNQEKDCNLRKSYQTIAQYLLAFYLYEWKPENKQMIFRALTFDSDDEDEQSNIIIQKPFDIMSAAQERLSLRASYADFNGVLLPITRMQRSMSNKKLIQDCIEDSPLYYLLCFNAQHQEIKDRLNNICTGRYELPQAEKNRLMLSQLVDSLIGDYKDCQNYLVQFPDDAASLSKAHYAENVLRQTLNLVVQHLARSQPDHLNSPITFDDSTHLCSYDFKDLALTALMIKNTLQLHDSLLNDLIVVKNKHIEQVVYEFHELKNKHEIGGGHLNRELPYELDINGKQHSIKYAQPMIENTLTGVSFCDWIICNDQGHYTDHKSSTVFPPCFNQQFWSGYVLQLLAQNHETRNIYCYDSGKRQKEKDGFYKRMVIFQHQHEIGCAADDCTYNKNSIMYIAAVIREEAIDKSGDHNDSGNLLRSLISLYPLSVYCLEYDHTQQCLMLNNESISTDNDLKRLIPNYLDYKRQAHADQGLAYDLDGKPQYEEVSLSYNTIIEALQNASNKLLQKSNKTIAGNIDASLIEITDPHSGDEYILVKVAQGIIVKILRMELASFAC